MLSRQIAAQDMRYAPNLLYDVTAYGAVADSNGTAGSGTDNTAAVIAAIAAASATGGTVWFPPNASSYRCATTAISITASNVNVRGAGTGASKLFFDSTNTTAFSRLVFDGGTGSSFISNNGCSDLTVYNLAGVTSSDPLFGFDGSASVVTFRNCLQFSITQCEVFNSPNYGLSVLNSAYGLIYGNSSHDQGADGLHIQSGSHDIIVANNRIHTTQDDGIGIGYWGAQNDGIIVQGNIISGIGGMGVAIYAPSSNITIGANRIASTWLGGVRVEGIAQLGNTAISNVAVVGNVIDGPGMRPTSEISRVTDVAVGIRLTPQGGTLKTIVVADNTITNAMNGYIWADAAGLSGSGGSTQDLSVTGNICSGMSVGGAGLSAGGGTSQPPTDGLYPAIKIRNTIGARVSGNTIRGADMGGVLADAGNALVQVCDNIFVGANSSNTAFTYGVAITNGSGVAIGNTASSSPNLTAMTNITTTVANANNNLI